MNEHSNQSSKKVVIIVIIVLILASSVGAWYWMIYKPKQEAIEKARLEQMANEEAENKRKELEAQNKAKYDNLIENANTAFEQAQWETANALYTEASSLFPDQQYPLDQLTILNIKLDEMAALEAKRAAGVFETVSSITGRFYIIVSSSIDSDLAADYASKLASKGNNVKIIEHDDAKHLYFRVAIGDYPTRQQAEVSLSSYSSYGNGVWILKY